MARALEGIRVVDFSHVVAGPLATHFLALNGAEVIKVEPPAGDPLRNYTADPGQTGMAAAFRGMNLGKTSIVLDLKTEAGRAAALDLCDGADVVVENFRPGVMERLGLGPAAVRARNPGVIYASISGFGQEGPMAQRPAIDQIVQSLSGLMLVSGSEGDPAQRIGIPIVDTFTGLLAAFAIQTALLQRARGLVQGQRVDVAMLDAALVMMLSVVNPLLIAGERPVRMGNRGFSRAPTADTFPTAAGEITVGAVEEGQVARLLGVLGLSDLLDDPAFADRQARMRNAEALAARLRAAFAARPAAEWEGLLNDAGVPAARVLDVAEALALPQLAHRGLILEIADDPPHLALNAGFRLETGSPGTDRPAPRPGGRVPETACIQGGHA